MKGIRSYPVISDLVTALGQFVGMVGLALLMVFLIGLVMAIPVVAVDVWVSRHSASTEDARGFSEVGFAKVTSGMEPSEVEAILGGPLKITGKSGRQEWWYTLPKEPIDGFGTWDARWLIFSNGVVSEVSARKLYNH